MLTGEERRGAELCCKCSLLMRLVCIFYGFALGCCVVSCGCLFISPRGSSLEESNHLSLLSQLYGSLENDNDN